MCSNFGNGCRVFIRRVINVVNSRKLEVRNNMETEKVETNEDGDPIPEHELSDVDAPKNKWCLSLYSKWRPIYINLYSNAYQSLQTLWNQMELTQFLSSCVSEIQQGSSLECVQLQSHACKTHGGFIRNQRKRHIYWRNMALGRCFPIEWKIVEEEQLSKGKTLVPHTSTTIKRKGQ